MLTSLSKLHTALTFVHHVVQDGEYPQSQRAIKRNQELPANTSGVLVPLRRGQCSSPTKDRV